MPTYELLYAQATACEGVRVALRLGGHDFIETRIDKAQMDEQNIVCCALNVDKGTKMFKMGSAILRLIGKLSLVDGKPLYPLGATPADALMGLEVDNAVDTMREMKGKVMPLLREADADRRTVALQRLKEEVMPPYFGYFEDNCQKLGGFVAGPHMTVADLELVGILTFIVLSADTGFLLDDYPALKKMYEMLDTHEGLNTARKAAGTKRH